MKFNELVLLTREQGGSRIRREILGFLNLPMPVDVLEQFVYDHGLNEIFQEQYGQIDLQLLRWECEQRPARELIQASVHQGFDQHERTATDIAAVATAGWEAVCLPPGAAEAWQRAGTWLRPPVMLDGALIGTTAALHLVEGHTRLGALRGLVDIGVLNAELPHEVWIGRATESPTEPQPRIIPEEYRISFLGWLFDQMMRTDDVGALAMWLVDHRPLGENIESVHTHVRRQHPEAQAAVERAITEWRHVFPDSWIVPHDRARP